MTDTPTTITINRLVYAYRAYRTECGFLKADMSEEELTELVSFVSRERVGIHPGDVVQIDPDNEHGFGGCFMQVTEVKPWGVQGFVSLPAKNGSTQAYYRTEFKNIVKIGAAAWVAAIDSEEQGSNESTGDT